MRTLDLAIIVACLGLAGTSLAKERTDIAVLSLLLATILCVARYLETKAARPPRPPPPAQDD